MLWVDLQRRGYHETWDLQNRLRQARLEGKIDNVILFVEHPPVVTVGKQKDSWNDFLKSPEEISKTGVSIIASNRGGRLTYHGPGQLVIYFIFDLKSLGVSIKQLVCQLEKSTLSVLEKLGGKGILREGTPGVWIGEKKAAFVGMHVARGVTQHGLSINISDDLENWENIIPCGLEKGCVTSLEKALGHSIEAPVIKKLFLNSFAAFWGVAQEISVQEISLISEKVGLVDSVSDSPAEVFSCAGSSSV